MKTHKTTPSEITVSLNMSREENEKLAKDLARTIDIAWQAARDSPTRTIDDDIRSINNVRQILLALRVIVL